MELARVVVKSKGKGTKMVMMKDTKSSAVKRQLDGYREHIRVDLIKPF